MNKTLIALTLCTLAGGVNADVGDTWLNIHGFSSHLRHSGYYDTTEVPAYNVVTQSAYTSEHLEYIPYNQVNLGLGVSYEFVDGIDARVGFFDNSFHELSVYGAMNWHTSYSRFVAVGVQVGVISGYQDTPIGTGEPVMFMALPALSFQASDYRIEFGYIPSGSTATATDVITMTIGMRF